MDVFLFFSSDSFIFLSVPTTDKPRPQETSVRLTSRSKKTSSNKNWQPSLATSFSVFSMAASLRLFSVDCEYFRFRLFIDSLDERMIIRISSRSKRRERARPAYPVSHAQTLIKNQGERKRKNKKNVLKGLAVIDDGDHVLDVALWALAILQMLLFVSNGLVPVPETQGDTTRSFRRRNSAGKM